MSNKTDFLKEAQAKYKKAVEKEWVAEMNFIYSPQLILRIWFNPNHDKDETGFMHRWCTVENIGDETIFNKFDEFLCEDNEDFPLILLALKKAFKKDKAQMIDHVEYKKDSTITPTENFEFTFTVKDFCEQVGIKLEGE